MLGKFQSPWISEMEPLLPALSVCASPSQRLKPTVLSLESGILPYSVPTCCRGAGTHVVSLTYSQGHSHMYLCKSQEQLCPVWRRLTSAWLMSSTWSQPFRDSLGSKNPPRKSE